MQVGERTMGEWPNYFECERSTFFLAASWKRACYRRMNDEQVCPPFLGLHLGSIFEAESDIFTGFNAVGFGDYDEFISFEGSPLLFE